MEGEEDLMRVFMTMKDDGSSVPGIHPMSFTFWPSSLYQDNIVKIIEDNGGVVVKYKKANENEYTITFINFPMIADWKDQEQFWNKKLPTDGYLMTFIEDFKKEPDPEKVNLSEYSMTPTAYEEHDVTEIMFQRKKWSELEPLQKSSVERITVKDILSILEELDMPDDSAVRASYKDGESVDSEEEEEEEETDDEEEMDIASDSSGDTVVVPSKSRASPMKESNKKAKPAQGQRVEYVTEVFQPPLDKKGEANRAKKLASNRSATATNNQNLDDTDVPRRSKTAPSSKSTKPRPRSSSPSQLNDDNDSNIALSLSSLSDDKSEGDNVSYDSSSGPSPSRSRSYASTSSRVAKGGGRKRGARRRDYSVSDGQRILDLILANRWGSYVKGMDLWKFIADNHLVEYKIGEHSHQSLRNHYIRKVEPTLLAEQKSREKTYTADADAWKTYKRDQANIIKPHTNVFHPPSVRQVKGVNHEQLKEFTKKLSEEKRKQ